MGTSFAPFLLALEPEPSDITVVITGLLLVFLILVLLTFIITLQGKFFDALEAKKKQAKVQPAPPPAPSRPSAPVGGGNVSAAAVLPAPGSVAPEIVAVIAAAVASLEPGSFTIRSIKPVSRTAQASGRKAWGQAGVQSNTAPF